MKEKYYIMPKAKFCFGTEKANSNAEAIRQFTERIGGDMSKILRASKDFSKDRTMTCYRPPMNGFEILVNCIVESLKAKPDRLYNINGAVAHIRHDDIGLLMHLQSAYEHARANETDMDAVAAIYEDIAMKSLNIRINKHELPKIALISRDWKEGGTTALLSEDIPFDIYGDGRIICLEKDIDAIRRALKEVCIHVRRI